MYKIFNVAPVKYKDLRSDSNTSCEIIKFLSGK